LPRAVSGIEYGRIRPGNGILLRFKEKGGKEKELPVHHKLEEILDQYLEATGLEKEQVSVLLTAPTVSGRILLK
jgi:integrase/recombinase XerD